MFDGITGAILGKLAYDNNKGGSRHRGWYEDILDQLNQTTGAGLRGQEGTAGGLGMILDQLSRLSTQGMGMDQATDFMQLSAPFLAGQLGNTRAFQETQNFGNVGDMTQQFGVGAGQLGQAGSQASAAMNQGYAQSGLGRSSGLAGGQAGIQAQVGGQQANLFSDLYQRQIQNRQNFANNALDANRMLSSLALGHNPAPRVKQPEADYLSAGIGAAGSALGGFLGGL